MSHFLGGAKGVVNKFSRHTTKPFEIIKLKKSQIKEAQKEKQTALNRYTSMMIPNQRPKLLQTTPENREKITRVFMYQQQKLL